MHPAVAACLCTTMLFLFVLLDTARPIAIVASPRICMSPCVVRLKTTLLPDMRNRHLTIALVSDDFLRSSTNDVEGEHAPVTTWAEYAGIPSGEYDALAIVQRNDGTEARAHTSVLVQ